MQRTPRDPNESSCSWRRGGRSVRLAIAALVAGVASALAGVVTPAHAGAVAFAKVSTNLGSSNSHWLYEADPGDLGPFDEPRGGVDDNGKTSAAAGAPCEPGIQLCDSVNLLVPGAGGWATAVANLASGTLRVYASTEGRVFDPSFGDFVALLGAEAYAGFSDTVTALSDGVMHFDLHISGTDVSDPRDGGTADYIDFLINGAFARTTDGRSLASNDGVTGFGCGGGDPGINVCDVDLLVDVPVTAGDALDLSLLLGVVASDATADYSHTLTLSASGVPFSSASGVFLTAATVDVPEPSALAVLGLGALGLLARRKQRG